jgi:hypothetical protein
VTLALNILLATCALIGSIAAIGGDTWRKGHVAWRHRVTVRGWIAVTCLFLAFASGVAKEVVTRQDSKVKEAARAEQDQQVRGKLSRLEKLLIKVSADIAQLSPNPEDESAKFRRLVKDSGFPDIAERLYRVVPSDRVRVGVNVRSEPSPDSPVIGLLKPGTAVRFVRSVPRWLLVQTPDGTTGYVSKFWVEIIK